MYYYIKSYDFCIIFNLKHFQKCITSNFVYPLLGVPVGIRDAHELFDMERIIKDTLQDDSHVFVVLKGIF